jgi:DmsE family decaheme c-type cytochrome
MRRRTVVNVLFSSGLILLVFSLYHCSQGLIRATIPKIEGANYVGDATCKDCHEEHSAEFKKSIHGRLGKFEAVGKRKGCESCHGPGSLHVTDGDTSKIIRQAQLTPAQKSEICLQCHNKPYWRTSEHPLNETGCSDCHKIHKSEGKYLLSKKEPALCFTCHKDIRAKTLYPSHHPIFEAERTGRKRMNCSDCHNVHGSPVRGLQANARSNEVCIKCHAKYQGPFIYEHSPVVEDCNICHEPHGSVANNLLKQNEPFLCLQCHSFHFHVGKQSVAGDFSNPLHQQYFEDSANENPVLHGDFPQHGFKKAFATKCTQCHSKIHGSDLPSQGIPGRGKALTR